MEKALDFTKNSISKYSSVKWGDNFGCSHACFTLLNFVDFNVSIEMSE